MPRSVLYDRANERSGGSEVTKTEKHIVGEHESGWIFTSEVPLEEAPSTVSVTGSTGDWTEVTDGTPAAKEYDVAYDIATPESRGGAVKFNSSDDGEAVTIVYEGRGTKPFAGMFNDLQRIVGPWNINLPKAVADTPDDDFDSSTHFSGLWTAVSGSTGSISLTGAGSTGSGGLYQLFPDHSLLLAQISNGKHVHLRQDYTLPSGRSIIAKVTPAVTDINTAATSAVEILLALNGSTSTPEPGSGVSFHAIVQTINDASGIGIRSSFRNDASATTVSASKQYDLGGAPFYLRIARSSLTYYAYSSRDGLTWNSLKSVTVGSAPGRLWLSFMSQAALANPQPVCAVEWLREGSASYFPW
jgi:hypothetical protein